MVDKEEDARIIITERPTSQITDEDKKLLGTDLKMFENENDLARDGYVVQS